MKKFLLNFSRVTAVTVLVLVLGPAVRGQQADQDPAPATPHQRQAAAQHQQNEAQMPASGEATAQEAATFTGRIVKKNGQFVLKDPVTKVSYKLDDMAKAMHYAGKEVKVTGKLETKSNTIHIEVSDYSRHESGLSRALGCGELEGAGRHRIEDELPS